MRIIYMVGGFGTTDELILSKMIGYGYDIYVIYTRPEPAKYKILEKVKVKWVNLNRFQYLPKIFRWLIFSKEIVSFVRKIKPDIVLPQGIQVHGSLAVLSMNRPILLLPWGSDWAIVANKNKIMLLLSRFVINHADIIQIDCEAGKNVILELSKGKIKPEDIWIFPRGIELNIFKSNPNMRKRLRQEWGWLDKKVLIMTRNLKPIYGVDLFLQALGMIVQIDQDVRALIVGGGSLENELKSLSVSLGLKDLIRFTGRIKRVDLVNYLNAADIYVSTSYSDGTSLSLLEAMAVGLPAVVTDVPSNLEWIKHGYNGFIARRGDPESIEEALLRLLKNRKLWSLFGNRSMMITQERADWDKNFDKFVRMFDILSQKKS